MTRVFISHATEDGDMVAELEVVLERHGVSCYVATKDVRPGEPLTTKVKNAIETSDALVVILTGNSIASPWVQQEIGHAEGKMPIIPLKVAGVRPPAMLEGRECILYDKGDLDKLATCVKDAISRWKGTQASSDAELREVCDEGPYDIDPGCYVDILLNAKKGDHIVGTLEEEESLDFEFGIIEERELVNFKNSVRSDYLAYDEGSGAYPFDWKVRSNKRWYLLLTIYGKKTTRTVSVRLRYEKK